ncbi:MAG: hypothetical protein ACI8UP_002360 [Porticoccaceae bacterium]|jgi:hypothetical protein
MNRDAARKLKVEADESLIRAELDRVLADRRFSGAPQMSAFLSYIVNQTLLGDADRIKAFSVGVDALGKPDSFDAQTDPSVRVLALRLRRTLATMYNDLHECKAIIELRVGTYVPAFYQVPKLPQLSKIGENELSVASLVTPNGRLGMAASDVDFTQTPVPVEPELCEI